MKAVLAIVVAILFFTLAIAQEHSTKEEPTPPGPRHQCMMMGGMGGKPMTKRAEIRVVPMARVEQEKQETAKLRQLVADIEASAAAIKSKDPAVQKNLELQSVLAKSLQQHLDAYNSDAGKSETALSVEKKLNAMEGQRMCGACHGHGGMGMMGGMGGRAGE